jgi:crossover junction endodeoxyribonuclease RuvC
VIYVGIDPGLTGAVAAIFPTGAVQTWDAPTAWDGKKNRLLISDMRKILKTIVAAGDPRDRPDLAIRAAIERVHSMPEQGISSAFSFGEGFGYWQGLLSGLEIPFDLVTPQAWKKALLAGAAKEKDASRIRAQQLFPTADLRLKKHHGRAEALLIAEYRRRQG